MSATKEGNVTDWKEAARGVPAWPGAVILREGLVFKDWQPGVYIADGQVYDVRNGLMSPSTMVIPCLTNHETRAAYDRRLALALGAPSEVVARGVRVVVERRFIGPSVYVTAGARWRYDHEGRRQLVDEWTAEVDVDSEDELTALALAWPADKRVTT